MSALVVTAANELYAPLLRDLIASLADHRNACKLAIAVLDLGLEPATRDEIAREVEHVARRDRVRAHGIDAVGRHAGEILGHGRGRREIGALLVGPEGAVGDSPYVDLLGATENGFSMRFQAGRVTPLRHVGVPSPCVVDSMPIEVENPCVPPAAPRKRVPGLSLGAGDGQGTNYPFSWHPPGQPEKRHPCSVCTPPRRLCRALSIVAASDSFATRSDRIVKPIWPAFWVVLAGCWTYRPDIVFCGALHEAGYWCELQ